jgi:TM2 domain-containing membrane protein YozV
MEPQAPRPQQGPNTDDISPNSSTPTFPVAQSSAVQPQAPQPVIPQAQFADTGFVATAAVTGSGGGAFVGSAGVLPAGESEKSFLVTFLLAFFLPWLGADKFYLGKIGLGVLKILSLLTFIGYIVWATLDTIMLLAGKTKDKDGNQLSGYEQNRKIAFAVFIIFTLISVLAGAFTVYTVTKAAKDVVNTVSDTVKEVSKDCPNGACTVDLAPTKFQEVVSTEGIDASVVAAQIDPAITGEAAEDGKQYVVVNILVSNKQSSSMAMPGMFYYKTSDGTLVADTSTVSGSSADSPKNVRLADDVTGSGNLSGISTLKPNTAYAGQYLIFHVPKGELGQVVWFQNALDTNSRKLAIFELK